MLILIHRGEIEKLWCIGSDGFCWKIGHFVKYRWMKSMRRKLNARCKCCCWYRNTSDIIDACFLILLWDIAKVIYEEKLYLWYFLSDQASNNQMENWKRNRCCAITKLWKVIKSDIHSLLDISWYILFHIIIRNISWYICCSILWSMYWYIYMVNTVITSVQRVPAARNKLRFFVLLKPYSALYENWLSTE